ncbi:zinc-binding dehydrogenase [Roseibium sp. CAU 1637]|uniref:Zinc-binding dehydrogenase n=1 Tax=Roseibium limicola TaxID=2816037 RepID=A0A939J7X0_9HYPH|nr:zinc-binding dehydrogenase [Roseibium limicola]MBO0344691.1 zinc-binding dehydrogenase [Roseibium limicola]
MKTIAYVTFGEPEAVLYVSDTDKPSAAAGEVLLRMVLSPIHNHDLWTTRGKYGYKPDLPAQGGTEALGIVEAVGEGVDTELIGKRVVAAGVQASWSAYFTAKAEAIVPLPDQISDEVGCQLIAMPFSALALLEFLDVQKGDWVIQTASNGTVGKVFADLAKARGINTLNLVRRAEAVSELQDLGFANVLSTSEDGWQNKARTIIGDTGARAAVDSVGGPVVEDIAELLGVDGLLVVFGSGAGVPLQLSAMTMISKHLVVKGFWGSRVIGDMPADEKRRLIVELVTLAAKNELRLSAGGIFPLEDIKSAVEASLTAGKSGKILLRP